MTGQCKFCNEVKDLREGGCWECANAEAIIDEGLDMYDKGTKDASPGQKLKLLIERGWTSKHQTPLAKAINVLSDSLREDRNEGSYYYSWQANIAMAFFDECESFCKQNKKQSLNSGAFAEVGNRAAKRFLDQLIK